MSRLSFENKLVVVTGAASGLGRELAKRMAVAEKAHLVVADCRADRLETLKAEIEAVCSSKVHVVSVDLGSGDGAKTLFEKATALGNVYALINNAGLSFFGKTLDRPFSAYRELIQVNCLTVLETTTAFLGYFLEKGEGAILNVTSLGGLVTLPYQNFYAATKHAVQTFSEGLSSEYRNRGVVICTFAPGGIATEMITKSGLDKHFGENNRVLMHPERAAELAVRGFKKKKLINVPGILSKLVIITQRIIPRKTVIRETDRIYAPKKR
ncbi:MAG: SDR family NAD(P)-dependent oxidoreductase [Candidatus Aminicenantes bacterium]|nr:SDR family NAD(P)-dependent oxidoreductase [Candidatus Aminicenantes bacterium]